MLLDMLEKASLDVSIACGYIWEYSDTLYLDNQIPDLSVSEQPQSPSPLDGLG
jgi:hypothetical protein